MTAPPLVTLYAFSHRNEAWRYTDQLEDVTVDGVLYHAATIAHERNDASPAGEWTVTCAEATPVVDALGAALDAIGQRGHRIVCTIWQAQRDGRGGVTTPAVQFKGVVRGHAIEAGVCRFRVASLATVLDEPFMVVLPPFVKAG